MNVNTEFHLATSAAWWTPPTATDNSGVAVTLTSNYIPGDNFTIGKTTVIYEAVDIYGNTANYSFDIVVTGNVFLLILKIHLIILGPCAT